MRLAGCRAHGEHAGLRVEAVNLAHAAVRLALQASHQHTASYSRHMRIRCHVPLQTHVHRLDPYHFPLLALSHTHFNPPLLHRRVGFSLHNRTAAVQIRALSQILQHHAIAHAEVVLPGRRRRAVDSSASALERFGHRSERFGAAIFRLERLYCAAQLLHQSRHERIGMGAG